MRRVATERDRECARPPHATLIDEPRDRLKTKIDMMAAIMRLALAMLVCGDSMMTKIPTRSPTHEDVEPSRLASMGLELEDIADGDEVALAALVELAEDRGRPASHYLAAIPLATELRARRRRAARRVRVCAGNCQR